MKFIDLFAGLGGFHIALSDLGHDCVFSSELSQDLRDLYEENFGIEPEGDIRPIVDNDIDQIPPHDILCAGFPCQPFSKAGSQQGFDCPQRGNLFDYVLRILERRKPSYFILENVPNIRKHNNGRTWRTLMEKLAALGYGTNGVAAEDLSPHKFGIPQIRRRTFIVGSQHGLSHFKWPESSESSEPRIHDILDKDPKEKSKLSPHYLSCLEVWQEFLDNYPKDEALPSFPIWSMEFGAQYRYKRTTPYMQSPRNIRRNGGRYGMPLYSREIADDELLEYLPSHARRSDERFPDWKIRFIEDNRKLGARLKDKEWFGSWLEKIKQFPSSLRKLEWNCKGEESRDLSDYLIQFRASGVRVKRPTTAPSLVAMTTTQIPVVGWENRYMTMRECARLQSMEDIQLPSSTNKAFKALGNAVNAQLVSMIARSLLSPISENRRPSPIQVSGDGVVNRIEPASVDLVCLPNSPDQLTLGMP